MLSASRGYIASLAEQNGRSGLLAKAMVDSNVAVLEVAEGEKTMFIAPEDKKESQTVRRIWNNRGSLLTLTVVEAVQCGIANGILNNDKEVISEFGFEEPRIVHNQDTIRARAQFEIVKTNVKNLYNDIDYLRKDISLKLAQYSPVDRLYHNTVHITYGYGYYNTGSRGARELSDRRKILKSTLLKSLENLKLKYSGVVALGKANPDLQIDREELDKEMNTIDVLHKNIKADLLFEIPREFMIEIAPTGQDINRKKYTSPQRDNIQ
jgi:hypothetical protein